MTVCVYYTVNYWAIGVGAILSMIIGALWYGALFGNRWMEIIGVDPTDEEKMQAMQKSAMPLYGVQFILTLFQVVVLAHLVASSTIIGGYQIVLWAWSGLVIPTLAGAIMWTDKSNKLKRSQFLIQAGYQLVMFSIFGALLELWK